MRLVDRGGAVALLVGLLALPASAVAVSPAARAPQNAAARAAKPFFDSRAGDRAPAAAIERSRPARSRMRDRLGPQAVVEVDRVTGTARAIQRLDGALTAPAEGDRADVARRWLSANHDAVGITATDVDELRLDGRITTANGLTHLRFRQADRGIPAFDNDVRVSLDRGGRIVTVGGSPLRAPRVDSIAPRVGPVEAMRALQADVGIRRTIDVVSGPDGVRRETRFAHDDFARLVLFGSASGPRLAWHLTYQASSTAYYDAVVDASDGTILFRQNLTKFAANAAVFRNYPGAEDAAPPKGPGNAPAPVTVNLEDGGWLAPGAPTLQGPFAHAYSDIDDDNVADATEEVGRSAPAEFQYPFVPFGPPMGQPNACEFDGPNSLEPFRTGDCSWNPNLSGSWQTNRKQNAVQAFYLANRFHDHLKNDPDIGFDAASGAFENADPVRIETDDGAATGPDDDHVNNANMSTPPDGRPARMQMYLFKYDPGDTFRFRNINAGDDAATVWHEYTHGLSNRLVTHADGSGAVSSIHAGAMGEGWSDWYALDLLHREGLEFDTSAPGEVDIGVYSDAVFTTTRFQPLDCPVGSTAPECPGGIGGAGSGGFTFGDFGKVAHGPEVHFDGEIWGETLWDLRRALIVELNDGIAGSDYAQKLITEGMRLSPPEPSFLDMRNAILAAETALGGAHRDLVWGVFAARGMGFFASVSGSSDTTAIESTALPPDPNAPKGTVQGKVTDFDSGLPLSGVRVGFGGLQDPNAPGGVTSATTGLDGMYALTAPEGTYGELLFTSDRGYDGVAAENVLVVGGQTTTRDVRLRRNWASSAGGAAVTGSDNTGASAGCGLRALIDQSLGSGWSAFNPSSDDSDNPRAGSPTAMIELPQAVDIESFGMDPSNSCGDDDDSATKDYRVETSADGENFQEAKTGAFSLTDRGRLNTVTPTVEAKAISFVRLTLLSPQSTSGSGADFIDFSEFAVYGNGVPQGTLEASPATVQTGGKVAFAASSFVDPDGMIAGYDWDFDGDGSTDRSTAADATEFSYASAGTYHARVRVRDDRGGVGEAAATITVTAPPGPSPTPTPTVTPAPQVRLPILSLPRRGSRGRLRLTVRCFARCTATGSLALSRATARRLRQKRRTIGTFRRTVTRTTSAQAITLQVTKRLRASARRRKVKTLTLMLTVKAAYADGRSTSAKRNVRVRL